MDERAGLPEAYAAARRAVLGEAIALLQKACSGAVATLRTVMIATDTKASIKVQAARTLLELGCAAIKLEDVSQRFAALEDALTLHKEMRRGH